MIFNFFKKKRKKTWYENTIDKFPVEKTLSFKSNKDAYEYVQKFFSNSKLEKKGLYHGIYVQPHFVRTHCLDDNNNVVFTFVCVDKSKDLKKDINIGDFVLIGIEEAKKPFTTQTLDKVPKGKNNNETAWNLSKAMVDEAPRGTILKKLTLELDIKTGEFVFDE